ncbi:MAG: hypothetical protein A2046_04985 [Bacteroidetes bacterium GWA2_30_7]|nr:MAG: hypothetical protein A2046_04985 [Bacteroidetes bacterium GWA2_30_7]
MKKNNYFLTNIKYDFLDDGSILNFIKITRKGVDYQLFTSIANKSLFSMQEWSVILNMSLRSIQRYNKEKKSFDRMQSERILEIGIVYNRGIEVFGDINKFNLWLDSTNIAIGGVKPKELFDSSFGINLVLDELTRIEHGVLA